MSSWAPTKYKTKNWSSYDDRFKRRGLLSIWFDPEMIWTPPPSGKHGRQQQFSDAAIQTCLTIARQGIVKQCPERGIDEETLEVWAVEVTSSNIGDAPVLPELLNEIPADQVIGSGTAPSHACKHALTGNGWSV